MSGSKIVSAVKEFGASLLKLFQFCFFIGVLFVLFLFVIFLIPTNDRRDNNLVIEQGDAKDDVKIWISSRGLIAGHQIQLFSAQRGDKKHSKSSYGHYNKPVANYLFLNTETGESHWLYNHADYRIQSMKKLTKDKKVLALLLFVITEDSDNDGTLSDKDKKKLFLIKPDGTNMTEISGIDNQPIAAEKIYQAKSLTDTEAYVTYKQDGKLYYQKFSYPDYKQLQLKKIQGWK